MSSAITLDTIIGICSLLAGFGIYFFDVKKKLDQLVEKQEGILSKEQADDLAELYLDSVETHLNAAVEHYSENDMREHYADGDVNTIMLELQRAYNVVVRKSVRPMVSSFRLRGNHRFDDLVGNVSRRNVAAAFKLIQRSLQDAISQGKPVRDIAPIIKAAVTSANAEGKKLIEAAIKKCYPRSSHQ